jgi:hypothetical protein
MRLLYDAFESLWSSNEEYALKRFLIAAAAAAMVAAPLAAQAATPPNAAQMAPLQYPLGTWHCTWTDGTNTGAEDQVFEAALDGAWLQEKEVVTGAGGQPLVQSVHYTGYDPKLKSFVHVGPDADGTYEIALSPDGNLWHDGSSSGSFVHEKLSDTLRSMTDSFRSGGRTVSLKMSCRKTSS